VAKGTEDDGAIPTDAHARQDADREKSVNTVLLERRATFRNSLYIAVAAAIAPVVTSDLIGWTQQAALAIWQHLKIRITWGP
jgi:hypothetical protein